MVKEVRMREVCSSEYATLDSHHITQPYACKYHLASKVRKQISDKSALFSSASFADFDGAAEFYVSDGQYDFWDRAKQDPYYEKVVKQDEERLFDAESSIMLVGWEENYIDKGEAMPSTGLNYVVE